MTHLVARRTVAMQSRTARAFEEGGGLACTSSGMPSTPLPLSKGPTVHLALESLGWDDALAAAFEPLRSTHVPARISRVDRGAVDVFAAADDGTGLVSLRARTRPGDEPAVGDWAALAQETVDLTVDVVLPRRTAIQRAAVSGRSEAQVLAANVDVVLVTVPAFPEPRPAMVERMVALAWDSGATPVVVLTKADLSADAPGVADELAESAPGVDVVAVSAVGADGLLALAPYVAAGRTLCLIGRSGAGKSSLANALVGAQVLATADIRKDGKGRHTTTHRELVVLPDGGVLLDTPGLRGAGLWVTDEGLDRAFADVEELVELCRFADCRHETEPGCAVLSAIDDGRLSERRLDSWRKLQREARWMASRTDARLRAEQRQAWKIVHKEVRRSGRIRP
jgi:ribosome biogenesis GTPase